MINSTIAFREAGKVANVDTWVNCVDDLDVNVPRKGARLRPSSASRRTRTRTRILEAGREIFAMRGISPKVEDIAVAAGISRAGFYLHFKSLDDLAVAVFRREVQWQLRRYSGLTSEIVTDERKLRRWFTWFLASFRQERDYILIMYRALSIDTGHLRIRFNTNRQVLEDLGRRIPEFRLLNKSGGWNEKRMLSLYHLMRSLSDLSLHNAFDAWVGDPMFAIEQSAAKWTAFISSRD